MDYININRYPYRAPLAVVNVIRPYVEGKDYCELGTCSGEIMLLLSKFTKSAIGIEFDERRHALCIEKGLNVIHGDFTKIEIPKADVYYIWCDSPLKMYDFILKTPGTWILGRRPEDVPFDEPATIKIPFNEDGRSGIFELLIKIVE